MPRTVGELLTRSMRLAGILGAADAMDGNDASDALLSLNQMIDAWQAERLYAYAIEERTHPLTAGVGTYTVGPGGAINVPRPVRIEWAFTRDAQGYDRPISIVPDSVWAQITLKSLGNNFPEALYYQPNFPTGTINLWMLPTAGLTLRFGAWTVISEFPNLNTSVSLPPGYEQAIVMSLAEILCIEYDRPVTAPLVRQAATSRARIKQNNLPELRMACEFTGHGMNQVPYYRVVAGDY